MKVRRESEERIKEKDAVIERKEGEKVKMVERKEQEKREVEVRVRREVGERCSVEMERK